MKAVLKLRAEQPLTPPPGIVTVNIDRSTVINWRCGGKCRKVYLPSARLSITVSY
ncbi:hypothetical protein KCP70_09085 [Salmonella enterica subsp. enterica]|nr:hypothetical protein KCP70_09085 [Salmonella enterica subsp. enterica]